MEATFAKDPAVRRCAARWRSRAASCTRRIADWIAVCGGARSGFWRARSTPSRCRLSPLLNASRPDIWRKAIALVAEEHPPTRTCFIHRDYQHFNLLWSRDRLSGVIDWVEASVGPPDVDVGHCRLNLTVLFSADTAERFRQMYEAEAGREVDPWWDIQSLLPFGPEWKRFLPIQIDGRAPLDVDGMMSRMEDVLERTLRRL